LRLESGGQCHLRHYLRLESLEPLNLEKLLKEKSGIKLDIGCGGQKFAPDWVGMDAAELPGVDVVHNLLDIPYPFPDESVSTAIMSHVLEHIPKVSVIYKDGKLTTITPLLMVMDEIWRIMKPDGSIAIAVPHGMSGGFMQDPTHASQINESMWYYFDPLALDGYLYKYCRPKPWRLKTHENGEPYLYYDPAGNMEVVLVKRRWDDSYGR